MGDASEQAEVFVPKELRKLRKELRQRTGKDQHHIISIRQARLVLSLSDKEMKVIQEDYTEFTSPYTILQIRNKEELQAIYQELLYIKSQKPHIFQLLIFDEALQAYKIGRVTVQDLKDLEIDKIKLLISNQALQAYKTGRVTVQDLKDLEIDKIKLLISNQALEAYKTGKVTVRDLLARDIISIKRNILKAYAEHICNEESLDYIADLKDERKIELLISKEAIRTYKTGNVSVQDLNGLSEDKIELLISNQALEAYETGKVTVRDLLARDIISIKRNILKAYAEHICNEESLDYIIDLKDERQIELLISSQALQAYETGKVSVQDLKDLSEDKIKLLISDEALQVYNTGNVSAQDLNGLSKDKIKLLISSQALQAYKTGRVTVKDLNGLSKDKIKLLISNEACSTYVKWEHEKNHSQFSNLSAKDVILIKDLSGEIGENLFQKEVKGKRIEDVRRIEANLLEVLNSIKSHNQDFDVSSLDPGALQWGSLGKAKGEGLSKIFYDSCSYTTAGYVTGGIYLPESKLTKAFKKQLETYIEKNSTQQNSSSISL